MHEDRGYGERKKPRSHGRLTASVRTLYVFRWRGDGRMLTKLDTPVLAYLGFSLAGQAGEEYAAGADRGGRRQKAPKFKILSEADKVLVSGSFEYG